MIVTVTATSMDKDKAEILCEFDAEVGELTAMMRHELVERLCAATANMTLEVYTSGPPKGLTAPSFEPED